MEASATTWELDSDEIASIASEDLHEHRPNRWAGAKSTWRTLTEEDRLLWQSMKQIKDQDLAVHLYNAFALKRRGRNPETAQDLVVRTVSRYHLLYQKWNALTMELRNLVKKVFGHRPRHGLHGRSNINMCPKSASPTNSTTKMTILHFAERKRYSPVLSLKKKYLPLS